MVCYKSKISASSVVYFFKRLLTLPLGYNLFEIALF